ncbi:unnamed protein product [Ectocarpus fasciculatus]
MELGGEYAAMWNIQVQEREKMLEMEAERIAAMESDAAEMAGAIGDALAPDADVDAPAASNGTGTEEQKEYREPAAPPVAEATDAGTPADDDDDDAVADSGPGGDDNSGAAAAAAGNGHQKEPQQQQQQQQQQQEDGGADLTAAGKKKKKRKP